ncbi:Zn(2)-C6 fungal-type DNA-binding domain protein [Penicillium longicatenatum]|uniref:Zn(2)-C6 fungal-type DNA-binding domain protein n=1 Tax=Penicillium longicatenatum TaxID=1561947 RepID=UPI002547C12E|nr:Zn(2)-C6 fungal-type DNA-binding domain protein [Penicillium longicatenatum]KAJ5661150.1 Zn(2)-C6 fungal-type DNA-binding domain protein [Penicillium longicatenatum]
MRLKWPSVDYCKNVVMAHNPRISDHEFSQLGVPSTQAYFLQHFAKNISRIALAMDYDGNGYRRLLKAAINDELLLQSILAVTISHHSRWQQQSSLDESRVHHHQALIQLRNRLQDPVMACSENTLAAMMFLISYEVFNGSNRWRRHHAGVMAWIQTFGHTTVVDSFLKTWFSMINTQSALNAGVAILPQVEAWLSRPSSITQRTPAIDSFFGCSTDLPNLMLKAARLYSTMRSTERTDAPLPERLWLQLEQLQAELAAIKIDLNDTPPFSLACDNTDPRLSPIQYLTNQEIATRATAVAEIFRHATLVYTIRTMHAPAAIQHPEILKSVEIVVQLLPQVPDVVGPGSNLGWAFVVIGAELDAIEQREYFRGRLHSLRSLAIQNVASGELILEEVWRNRDAARLEEAKYRRWQEVMQDLEVEQILI